MASKQKADALKSILIVLRTVTVALFAFLLVQLGIVNDSTTSTKPLGLFLFALLFALPLTFLVDRYLIALAKILAKK